MALERSKGKLRPTLPRSRELRKVETVPDPSAGRAADGRFKPGNRLSVRAGEKHAVKKLLGKGATDAQAESLARDALRLHGSALRELPSDGAIVRTLSALYAREAAVSGFFAAQADAAGLGTPEGAAWAERSSKHGQRAERLAVTALDVATRMAEAREAPGVIDGAELARRVRALRANDVPAASPVDASTGACVGEGDDERETRHGGEEERDEGFPGEPDEAMNALDEGQEAPPAPPPMPPPGMTVAPPTFTSEPVPPRRQMLVSRSGAMPAPPPRNAQEALNSHKPPLPFWVQLVDERTVRSDCLPPDELARLHAEGRLP